MSVDEATLLEWTRTELLVPISHLAFAWKCDIRSLTAASKRGDLFFVEAFGDRWCLQWWTVESRDDVQRMCRAHGRLHPLDALEFWHMPHDKLRGRRPGMTLGEHDFELAVDLAREFGVHWRARQRVGSDERLRILSEAVMVALAPDGEPCGVDDEDRPMLASAWRLASSIVGEGFDTKAALATVPSWHQMPVLSVTHVRSETRAALRVGRLGLFVAAYGLGEVLSVPRKPIDVAELPSDVAAVLEWARATDHRWIRVDPDGDIVDALPRYRRSR